jgi:hypothetical protein
MGWSSSSGASGGGGGGGRGDGGSPRRASQAASSRRKSSARRGSRRAVVPGGGRARTLARLAALRRARGRRFGVRRPRRPRLRARRVVTGGFSHTTRRVVVAENFEETKEFRVICGGEMVMVSDLQVGRF